MPTKAEIIAQLEKSLETTRSARAPYLWVARDFLDFNGVGEITGDRVLKYLDHRERQGDRHYTLKMRYYALKYLLNEVLGISWKSKESAVFYSRERRVKPEPPVFAREEVSEIINAVKAKGDPQQKALFAVSTVYGCRRSELCDIRDGDLDFEEHIITIYTRKGGREAKQVIPSEIEPYLSDYGWEPIAPATLSTIFQEVMEITWGGKRPGVGFHAVRHCLVSVLRAEARRTHRFTSDDVYYFLRWAEPGIMTVYTHREIGEVEDLLFPYHPFIKEWG